MQVLGLQWDLLISGTSEIILPSFNHPPRADAGNDQMVKESDKVTLDGTHSTDVDRDKLKYSWQLTSPKKVKIEINDKHAAKADFTDSPS